MAFSLTSTWKGKVTQTNSPHSLSHTSYTFPWWVGFNLSATFSFDFHSDELSLRAPSLRLPQNGGEKPVWVSLILTCLDSSRWLSHTSLFLSLSFFQSILLSLSPPRWHVDSSLLVGISFQWAGWWGWVGGGAEGCGNHLHLRLLGSVPLGMLADTCHWAAVRQRGCGMRAQAAQVTVISFQKPQKLKP